MSVMIGVVHNGQLAIAADSMWASGWDKRLRVQPKIERRGDILMTVGPSSGYEYLLWN